MGVALWAAIIKSSSAQFDGGMQGLSSYLEGERALSQIPLALHGTAFQLSADDSVGNVQSYAEVASRRRRVQWPTPAVPIASRWWFRAIA